MAIVIGSLHKPTPSYKVQIRHIHLFNYLWLLAVYCTSLYVFMPTYLFFFTLFIASSSLSFSFLNIFLFFGGDFFSFFFLPYSALLHLPPLKFHCADGCWDLTYRTVATGALAVRCSNHSARSHPPCLQQEWSRPWSCWTWSAIGSPTSPPPSVS
jgi:hypothetical protein